MALVVIGVRCVIYADDVVLLAPCASALRCMLSFQSTRREIGSETTDNLSEDKNVTVQRPRAHT